MIDIAGYENRFVAFLDILGFKELIHKIEREKHKSHDFERVRSILNFLHEESIDSNGQHDLPVYEQKEGYVLEKELGDPRISYISDCVIISTEATFDGFRSLCNKITKFSTDIACDGIFLRGGITHGMVHHHGPFLFGSAYQKAYELESTVAVHPRIVLDKIIFSVLAEKLGTFPLDKHAVVEDQGGVSYLSSFPLNYYPQYTTSWLDFLLRVKGRILYHLNMFDPRVAGFGPELRKLDQSYCWKEAYGWDLCFDGGNEKVLKKYLWLKDEFNRTLRRYSQYLSANGSDSKFADGGRRRTRISALCWNGIIWSPEKELGRLR